MKYTPGTWTNELNHITTSDGETVAVVSYEQSGYVQGNTSLIAAAPELLEALEDCYSELNQLAFLSGDNLAKLTLDKARAAIDKAKGE